VRRFERFENLLRDLERLFNGHRPASKPFGERVAFDEFEDKKLRAVRFGEIVNSRDAGVIERGHGLRFAVETRDAVRIARIRLRQHLDRDAPIQLGVVREIDLAHPAGPKKADDFVRSETGTRGQRHAGLRYAEEVRPVNG
jgi:hypothetical protein